MQNASALPFALPSGNARLRRPLTWTAAAVFALVLAAVVVAVSFAQVGGDRGIAPVAASRDISVGGIEVDTRGDSATEARQAGWDEAAVLAWKKIEGPDLPESQIASFVSSIVIEREQIGPKRYIARLGVIFDRERAGRFLGGEVEARQSAPMLLIPVTVTAGTQTVYERRNPFQRAWAEFNPGTSRIQYVRPSGAGGDSLLVTYGQTGRRSRTWWRNVLDQFDASNVLVAIAELDYAYPGGPVAGTFTARYGPDSRVLDTFELRANSAAELPAMLARAVTRFDVIYQRALSAGRLRVDPTLDLGEVRIDPRIAALIERGRQADARVRAERATADRARSAQTSEDGAITDAPVNRPPPEGSVALYTVQVATPDTDAFNGAFAAVRGASNVRAVGTRSTAIGGTSVLTVSFAGSIGDLAQSLRAAGFTVQQGGSSLTISR